MFKTIVWATDGSETSDAALPYVRGLAEQNDAELLVVHVTDQAYRARETDPPNGDEKSEPETKIRAQSTRLTENGINTTLLISPSRRSNAAEGIIEVARDQGADLIVIGAHARGPALNLLLGSITNQLLHEAPCPVLAVPASLADSKGP